MQNDVHVYIVDLPSGVHECVMPDTEDDGYTVYLNRTLSEEARRRAFDHALKHINSRHFEDGKTVQEIEAEAHKKED